MAYDPNTEREGTFGMMGKRFWEGTTVCRPRYWRGTIIKQTWLARLLLRLAYWIDDVPKEWPSCH